MSWAKPYVDQYLGEHTIANADFAALMESVLSRGTPFRFRSAGFSMSPFIREGDVLTLVHPSGHPLRHGTVIAFVQPLSGSLAVHRVVVQRDGRYLLKGDNNRGHDGWVKPADVIGVVNCVERNGKTVHFGQGRIRWLIAWLSKYNFFYYGLRLRYTLTSLLFKGRKL
jgi:signal peptidase I